MVIKNQRPVLIQTFQKGRGLADLLRKFEPLFFPDQIGIAEAIINRLERSKQNIKGQNGKESGWEELVNYIAEGYQNYRYRGLRSAFNVQPDYMREKQPDRKVFGSIDTVMYGGIPIRLIGDLNSFENCRNNLVPIAITNADLVANLLQRELRSYRDENARDMQWILKKLNEEKVESTVKYAGPLNISESRTMMFASIFPSQLGGLEYDSKGIPVLGEEIPISINGEYWFLMKTLWEESRFREVRDVETDVFLKAGRWGAYIVDSGNTLLRTAEEAKMPLAVVRTPLFSSQGALFYNPVGDRRQEVGRVIGLMGDFNQQLPSGNGYARMCETLKDNFIGPASK